MIEAEQHHRGPIMQVPEGGFPRALYYVTRKRGYLDQGKFAKAIDTTQPALSYWYHGERVPSPNSFGKIIGFLDQVDPLSDTERDCLVQTYGECLSSGKGIPGGGVNTETRLNRGKSKMLAAR